MTGRSVAIAMLTLAGPALAQPDNASPRRAEGTLIAFRPLPAEAVMVEIVETEPTAKAKGGVLFSEMRR